MHESVRNDVVSFGKPGATSGTVLRDGAQRICTFSDRHPQRLIIHFCAHAFTTTTILQLGRLPLTTCRLSPALIPFTALKLKVEPRILEIRLVLPLVKHVRRVAVFADVCLELTGFPLIEVHAELASE